IDRPPISPRKAAEGDDPPRTAVGRSPECCASPRGTSTRLALTTPSHALPLHCPSAAARGMLSSEPLDESRSADDPLISGSRLAPDAKQRALIASDLHNTSS